MKVNSIKEAWNVADGIFPTDYAKDERASSAAGYDIYKSTADGVNAWISDLGSRLEINHDNGETVTIWIEPNEETAHDETTITLESVCTHISCGEETTTKREARLNLSAETTLKDVAQFERAARLLIKNARSAKNRGDVVTVTLAKGRYNYKAWDDMRQTRFEMWTAYGDDISADGVHLSPSEQYNEDPAHDMWLTGATGEILDEMTI